MTTDTGTATVDGEQTAEETPQAQGKNEQGQGEQGKNSTDQAQGKGTVPYARFQEVVEQRKGLESTLNSIVEGLVCDLPEDMRDLVPNLPAVEKVAWIKAAKERGLFSKGSEAASPPANSPDAKKPGGKTQVDLNGMSATEKLRYGFGQRK